MDEFLKQNYGLITHCVETIAAVTGLLVYRKYKDTTVKYFIWFLVYVVIIELVGSYPRYMANNESFSEIHLFLKNSHFENNFWFYTIFWIFGSGVFYALYFRSLIKSYNYKKTIKYMVISFVSMGMLYYFFNWQSLFSGRAGFIDVFGVIVILSAVSLYLVEILLSNQILKINKSLNFYVATTLILWYLMVTPLTFYSKYFSTADWNFVILKYQIFLMANVFMYLTFTFALIYCSPDHD
ncbi:MAG: hypothetical protein ACSHXF_13560 [Aquaticitalea sp.]